MPGASSKVAYSPLWKRLPFSCSIYVKKVMKLLAFIFEQPSQLLKVKINCKYQRVYVNNNNSVRQK